MVGVVWMAKTAGMVRVEGIVGLECGMEDPMCLSSLSSLHRTSVWKSSHDLSNLPSCS